EPSLALWEAVRTGASWRQRTFDRLHDRFLQNKYDPPDKGRLLERALIESRLRMSSSRLANLPRALAAPPWRQQTVLTPAPTKLSKLSGPPPRQQSPRPF